MRKLLRAFTVIATLALIITPLNSTSFATPPDHASAGANVGSGNNGNGVGNTGPGNQGNDRDVGNAGGDKNHGGDDHHGGGDNHGGGDDHHGGGDNHGGGNDHGGNDNNDNKSSPQKENARWVFNVAPIPYFDLDYSKKLVNQATADSFALDDYSAGLRLYQTYSVEGGLGLAGIWHRVGTGLSGIMPYVGVLPIAGKTVTSNQRIASPAEANKQALKLPETVSVLDGWQPGDVLAYQTSGTVVFFGGAGYMGFATGLAYTATGTWTVQIAKLPANKAYVKITSAKLRSWNKHLGTLVLALSRTSFNAVDNTFSFAFDLSNSNAALAFEDTIRGNIAAAQELAVKPESGVNFDTHVTTKQSGGKFTFWLGVPILMNVSNSSGTTYSDSETIYLADNNRVTLQYSAYTAAKQTKFFSRHSVTSKVFYGATATYKDGNEGGTEQFGVFQWTWQNDHARVKDLGWVLGQFAADTGIKQPLSLEIPKANNDHDGYLGVEFKMTFAEEALQRLVEKAGNRAEIAAIQAKGHAMVDNYFHMQRDPDALCPNADIFEDCVYGYSSELYWTVRSAAKALRELKIARETQDARRFNEAYSDFGRAMLNNRFSFQTIYSAMDEVAPALEMSVEGERLSRMKKTF